MVGIVLVSHSAALAQAVCDLAGQVGPGEVAIAPAGGVDAPDNPFGTDAFKIVQAVEQVYGPDGVLILMDLGSAILSAQMAVEDLLPEEWRPHVVLVGAPFVEGAVAAAVQAAAGADLAQVAAEAQRALAPKTEQLAESHACESGSPNLSIGEVQAQVEVRNLQGLHARPAARFVNAANWFQSEIRVLNSSTGTGPVDGKSSIGVMRIGARQGHVVVIGASGPDAEEAVAGLARLVEQGFGEEVAAGPRLTFQARRSGPAVDLAGQPSVHFDESQISDPAVPGPGDVLQGTGVSEGIAVGPARKWGSRLVVDKQPVADVDAEQKRFLAALFKAANDLQDFQLTATERVGAYNARIFEFHRQFLEDPELVVGVESLIKSERCNAEYAVATVVSKLAESLRDSDDRLVSERADDLQDVGRRLVGILSGDTTLPVLESEKPFVLLAHDLMASDAARLDPDSVLGIGTALGGTMSHAVILARSLGIPTVVGLGRDIERVADGTLLVVDGRQGTIHVSPDPTLVETMHQQQLALRSARELALREALAPAETRDGNRIEVVANIGNVAGASDAVAKGAEGVGVLRTEFLYIDRDTPPDEEEQTTAYAQIADELQGRPLVIRTLDIGGDKPSAFVRVEPELNPFLGCRAIRLSLTHPDLFRTQVRAILRAGWKRNVRMLLPMITGVEELRRARRLIEESRSQLLAAGMPCAEDMDVGIMIEVPAAALNARHLAMEADFLSIGANDLTQYVVAVDRTNSQCADLYDPLDPAVLRLIDMVVQAAHTAGKRAGVCGEMAGDPNAIPLLVGMGVDDLSMSPIAIPPAKQLIRDLASSRMEEVACRARSLESAAAVRDFLAAEGKSS